MSRIPSSVPIQQTAPPAANAVSGGPRDLRDVDLDQFLQLLITELQNQDPLNPLENSEMLQQISQIREISATNHLTDTLDAVLLGQNMSTASSLIGKQIQALTDGAENVEGVVDRVTVDVDESNESNRSLRLHVGEHQIQLNNVRQILAAE